MSTYTISENKIKKILNKYNQIINIGDMELLDECLKKMDGIKSQLGSEVVELQKQNEKIAPYIEYVSKIKTASFKEKLKFLFR